MVSTNDYIELFGKLHGMSEEEIEIVKHNLDESSEEGKILKKIHKIFSELNTYYENKVNPRMKARDGINDKLKVVDELIIKLLKSDVEHAGLNLTLILKVYPENIKKTQGDYLFYRRIIHWSQKIYIWNTVRSNI